MDIRSFVQAQMKAVDSSLPAEAWTVYENYEIVGDGDFVYVPPPPLERKEYPATGGFPSFGVWNTWTPDRGIKDLYFPLKLDGLFLEFAELVENRPIDAMVVVDWAERYGLLDKAWKPRLTFTTEPPDEGQPAWMRDYGTDRLQSVQDFRLAAREANRCLRLYEAAMAEKGPDYESLQLYGIEQDEPEEMRQTALMEAMVVVQRHLKAYSYPRLYYDKDSGQPLPVTGWGFHTLRGALYIQMARLLTAPPGNIRRCAYPGCTRIIRLEHQPDESSPPSLRSMKKNDRSKGYKTRKDKKYCSPKHRHAYYNEYVRPGKGNRDGLS